MFSFDHLSTGLSVVIVSSGDVISLTTISSFVVIFPTLSLAQTKKFASFVTFIILDLLHSTGTSVVSVIAYSAIPDNSSPVALSVSFAVITISPFSILTSAISGANLSILFTTTFSELHFQTHLLQLFHILHFEICVLTLP